MQIILDEMYHWRSGEHNGLLYYYAGSQDAVETLVAKAGNLNIHRIGRLARRLAGHFGVIIDQGCSIVAVCDHVRSYPIFYCKNAVSNSARVLRDKYRMFCHDELSALEFIMSGYVTGRDTLYRGLHQVQAGEIVCMKDNVRQHRYYSYLPVHPQTASTDALLEDLNSVSNSIFSDIAQEAEDRPILIPLSGGGDSRLLLYKLKELGCRDVSAFTYGPWGSEEAKTARRICQFLGVPWTFVHYTKAKFRRLTRNPIYLKYLDYAGQFCSTPITTELPALLELNPPKDTIIIPGHCGSWAGGGVHPPQRMFDLDIESDEVVKYILEKHYSLWPEYLTPANIRKIANKIESTIGISTACRPEGYYRMWDWQEAESKYFVNSVRTYDFLGLEWRLPLCDVRWLNFWRDRVPLAFKFRKRLYKSYLARFFGPQSAETNSTMWPGLALSSVAIARIVGCCAGHKYKDIAYKHLSWFSQNGAMYGIHTAMDLLKNAHRIRGVVSLNARKYLALNDFCPRIGDEAVCPKTLIPLRGQKCLVPLYPSIMEPDISCEGCKYKV